MNGNKRNNYKGSARGSKTSNKARNFSKDKKQKFAGSADETADISRRYDGGNDPSWYSAVPELVKASASLSFPFALGSNVIYPNDDTTTTISAQSTTISGIMSVGFWPHIGIAKDSMAPINTAARNLFTYVRKHNAGAVNYEAPDMMIYLICMDSIYMALGHAKRAYACSRTFSQTNWYTPEAMLAAMGFLPFGSRAPQVNARINYLINKASQLAVPTGMPYFQRHDWLVSNVFTDTREDSNKQQFFFYMPKGFVKFKPYDEETGGRASLVLPWDTNNGPMNIDDYLDIVDDMINAVVTEQDSAIISGDILKAFENNIVKVAYQNIDDTLTPTYSIEVVAQVRNISPLGSVIESLLAESYLRDDYISQSEGSITSPINFTYETKDDTWAGLMLKHGGYLLNFDWNYPTPDDVMVATRMLPAIKNIGGDNFEIVACGSEIPVDVAVWTNSYYGQDVIFNKVTIPPYRDFTGPVSNLEKLTKFSFYPHIYVGRLYASSGYVERRSTIGDINTYTTVGYQQLMPMHSTALMSEFNVPVMGSWAIK